MKCKPYIREIGELVAREIVIKIKLFNLFCDCLLNG